ncbi:MAG: hypothetical protein QOJ11_3086 [Frankiales bacterium]|jgi:hypothetical protein|nr:hypothetical protein [Frankiales bacterium]
MATKGPGHVYVLLEPMHPSFVKVGLTRKTTTARVKGLHGTSRAVPLIELWDEYVTDPELVEKAMHWRFAEERWTTRREFFSISPRVAISALMEEAAPYRLDRVVVGGYAPVLLRLHKAFPGIIDPLINDVAIVVDQGGVALRTTTRSGVGEETTVKAYLDFIYDGDEPIFTPDLSAEANAVRLLELDELTLVMCTSLVESSEAARIDRELNPYWTSMWQDLSDAD